MLLTLLPLQSLGKRTSEDDKANTNLKKGHWLEKFKLQMDNSIESLSINRSYTIEEFFRQSPSDLGYFSIPEAVYLRESDPREKPRS